MSNSYGTKKGQEPPQIGFYNPNAAPGYPAPGQAPYPTGTQPGYPAQAPYSTQPGYPAPGQAPYPTQPGYPAQGPYPTQPGYPVQTGYPMQPGAPVMMPVAPPPYSLEQSAPVNSSKPYATETQRGGGGVKPEDLPESFGDSFSTKAMRHAFIRKVYIILTVQLSVTVTFIAIFSGHAGARQFVQQNMWVYIASYVVFLVTYLTLVCCGKVRRKFPTNIIMLSIFTLSMSLVLGCISAFHSTQVVLMAAAVTLGVCFLITLFAFQTKIDFTGMHIYLFVAGMVLMIFGIMAIVMRSDVMHLLYSCGIALLFSMYLVYDTQMIVGGRKHEMSQEEHIFGALSLYMDVVMIFIALLGISRSS